jgi:hypothetical protein
MKTRAFSLIANAIASIPEADLLPLVDTEAPRSTLMGYLISGLMRDELLNFSELQAITTNRITQ